jgi:hypothetical protein
MKKLLIIAMVLAFGTAIGVPATAVIGSDAAFAGQKTTGKKKVKKQKKSKAPRQM